MVQNRVTLEVAAFLDSDPAKSIAGVDRPDVRAIADLFVELCYARLGKKPALLDAADLHAVLAHEMPGRMAIRDPLAVHVPTVLGAFFDHLEQSQLVPNAYELRTELARSSDEFLTTVRTGENAHLQAHAPVRQIVNRAPKLGRNDPCSCGSGKKYKKCHGKNE